MSFVNVIIFDFLLEPLNYCLTLSCLIALSLVSYLQSFMGNGFMLLDF